MSVLLRVLLLVVLVGLGFVAERHIVRDGWLAPVKTKAPVPKIATASDSGAAFEIGRKQIQMQLASADQPAKAVTAAPENAILAKNMQLLLISAPGMDDTACQMQRYRRPVASQAWEKIGPPAPCALGKAGMAFVAGFPGTGQGAEKKDGDGKTPAGVFVPSGAFGFKSAEEAKNLGVKLAYQEVGDTLVCAGDKGSPQSGRLYAPGSGKIPKGVNLAKGGEGNRWGLVLGALEQNPGPGPCQLIHVWAEPGKPDSAGIGCHEARMLELLAWLDPAFNPAVAVAPASEMAGLKAAWGLP